MYEMYEDGRELFSFENFESFWASVLQEKEDHLDDLSYQALTKDIAVMIWNHALASKIMKGD